MRRSILGALLVAILMFAGPAAAFDSFGLNVTGGLDFAGSFDGGDSFDVDAATGYSLGLEVVFELPIVELGAGLEYGFPRSTDFGDVDDVDVDYSFIYAVGRVDIIGPFFLAARVGYADMSADDILSGDVDGGATWSAGFGISLVDRFKVEAFFNNFSGEVDGLDSDFDYQNYSLRLVVCF